MPKKNDFNPPTRDLFWAFTLLWVRDELERQKLTRGELARRLGRSETAVSRWFSGELKGPGNTTTADIIEALDREPIATYRAIVKLWEADPHGDFLKNPRKLGQAAIAPKSKPRARRRP